MHKIKNAKMAQIRSKCMSILMLGLVIVAGVAAPIGYSLKAVAEERDVGNAETVGGVEDDGPGGAGGSGGAESDVGGDAGSGAEGDAGSSAEGGGASELGADDGGGEGSDEDDEDDEAKDEEPPEISEKIPEIYLKAISPGYKGEEGTGKVGEMIVIARKHADAPLSLAGATVGYTNTSGNTSVILEFPENSWMIGETLLLRYKNAPEGEQSNAVYNKTLAASSGGVELSIGGEVVDRVCWTGKDTCAKPFNGANAHTTLVRNLETGEWENLPEEKYEVKFDAEAYHVEGEPAADGDESDAPAAVGPSKCRGVQFSEILTYYENSKEEQFVELYNTRSEDVDLGGCQVRYKNKNYSLTGRVAADGYFAYYPEGFSLTKNPSTSNELQLIDANTETLDSLIYRKGQRKGTSYAMIGYDSAGEELWKITYDPTPGEPNNYREFRSCESGKVLNESTGNCVKVTSVKTTTCKAGYYLNVLTGRCNKVKTASAPAECKAGYYRDPTTNRCRKIKENNGADYSLEPQEYNEQSNFIALYAVLGVAGVGAVYLVYEFRHEIGRGFRKVFRKRR